MKNNDLNGNREFEKKLKDKMNELSSSVDCFEKISARAFPEKNPDFSDSEFTVSDLENVTGRHRGLPVLKWAAIAAAVVLCVGLLPKTEFFRNFYTSLGKDTDPAYQSIVAEMLRETEEHEYRVYDMPLKDYIEKDVLVTPYYSCPFEESERDDVKVRIFIRTVHDSLTNQIYAVEYTGSFTESSFLAVAESEAKFTDDELERLHEENTGWLHNAMANDTAAYSFIGERFADHIDDDGYTVTAASFTYDEYFKYGDDAFQLVSYILYYGRGTGEHDRYYYDIISEAQRNGDTERVEIPEQETLWKNSLNFDGSSAMPDTNGSRFEKTPLFEEAENSESIGNSAFFELLADAPEELLDNSLHTLELHRVEQVDFGVIGTLDIPADMYEKRSLRLYVTSSMRYYVFSSYSDPKMVIYSETGKKVMEINSDANIIVNYVYDSLEAYEKENAIKQKLLMEEDIAAEEERRQAAEDEAKRIDTEAKQREAQHYYEMQQFTETTETN